MDDIIIISNLNDFIFCPVSIYFHNLYGNRDVLTYKKEVQLNGTSVHNNVDNGEYSTRKDIVSGISAYSEKYNIICKIDNILSTCVSSVIFISLSIYSE